MENDKHFLARLTTRVALLGYANFVLIPCMFYVALVVGQVKSQVALVGIAAKALMGLFMQLQMGKDVAAWRGMNDTLTVERIAWDVLTNPMWMFNAFLAMIEFIDSDLDAVNAGESWGLPFELKDRIRVSWKHVPLLGRIVAFLGISGMLTLILTLATIVQVYEFYCMLRALRKVFIPQWRASTTTPFWRRTRAPRRTWRPTCLRREGVAHSSYIPVFAF